MSDRQFAVTVVVNWRRGSVYGATSDRHEARQWVRALTDESVASWAELRRPVPPIDMPELAVTATTDVVTVPDAVVAEIEAAALRRAGHAAIEWVDGALRSGMWRSLGGDGWVQGAKTIAEELLRHADQLDGDAASSPLSASQAAFQASGVVAVTPDPHSGPRGVSEPTDRDS